MFGKKNQYTYDKENQKPVIKASICTGEQRAGFKDMRTGKFDEMMLIESNKDLEEFARRCGIATEDIRKEY